MKKALFLFVLMVTAGSLCFAQQKTTATAKAKAKAPVAMTVSGTIDSLVPADAAKATDASIKIIVAKDKDLTMAVKASTVISDADGKPITFDKLVAGEKVKTQYITKKNGTNEAVSIALVK